MYVWSTDTSLPAWRSRAKHDIAGHSACFYISHKTNKPIERFSAAEGESRKMQGINQIQNWKNGSREEEKEDRAAEVDDHVKTQLDWQQSRSTWTGLMDVADFGG